MQKKIETPAEKSGICFYPQSESKIVNSIK
jgi:hypothetical protein